MAKTRLTKFMRAEICEAVMKATKKLWAEREKIEADTRDTCMAMVRADQPPGFYEVIAAAPKEWFSKMDSLLWRNNPKKRMCMAVNPADSWQHSDVQFNEDISVTSGYYADMSNREVDPRFAKLTKRAEAWAEKYSKTQGELRSFLLSCGTVESLLERMPELAPYIPEAQVSYPLVAPSNLLSTLLAEGFEPA